MKNNFLNVAQEVAFLLANPGFVSGSAADQNNQIGAVKKSFDLKIQTQEETEMNELFESRVCSFDQLRDLNSESLKAGYNRNIYFRIFYKNTRSQLKKKGLWNGREHTNILLIPLMIHQHKAFEPCEDHMRCQVFTDNGLFLLLDVPMESFKALITVDEHDKMKNTGKAA